MQTAAAACVCLALELCGGRRFPVIPVMQPKPEQLIGGEARPYNPSFLLSLAVQFYLEAGSCSECLHAVTSCPPEFMVLLHYPGCLWSQRACLHGDPNTRLLPTGYVHVVTPGSFPLPCALSRQAVMWQFSTQRVIRIAGNLVKSSVCPAGGAKVSDTFP